MDGGEGGGSLKSSCLLIANPVNEPSSLFTSE